jgi:hypothetical protein
MSLAQPGHFIVPDSTAVVGPVLTDRARRRASNIAASSVLR